MRRHRVNFVCVIDHKGLKVVLFRQSGDFSLGGGWGLQYGSLGKLVNEIVAIGTTVKFIGVLYC
jgi:hypothetical protein